MNQEVLTNDQAEMFLHQIAEDPQIHQECLTKADELCENLRIHDEQDLQIFFAPHNLYISPNTKVLIVGICPGKVQSRIALQVYAQEQSIIHAKIQARFAGQTRKNLLEMLNRLQLEKWLHEPPEVLLDHIDSGLDTIALIPFPVFVKGKNYSGHAPAISRNRLLREYVDAWFVPQLDRLPQLVILIPLGKAVEQVLIQLKKEGKIRKDIEILHGFPHPSGLNASRPRVFAENLTEMKAMLQHAFDPDRKTY